MSSVATIQPSIAPQGNGVQFAGENWTQAGRVVTDTPAQIRVRFLTNFVHRDVAPGGIEHMEANQFEKIFGEAATRRYQENARQMRDAAFDPHAYRFLQMVRRSANTAAQIANILQHVSNESGQTPCNELIKAWQCFPGLDAHEQFGRLREQTTQYLEKVGNAPSEINERARSIDKLLAESPVQKMLRMVDRDHGNGETGQDHIPGGKRHITYRDILGIESQFGQQDISEGNPASANARLEKLKAYAVSGFFCTDDLMRIAVGEPAFSEKLSKKLRSRIDEKHKATPDAFHEFYRTFQKILPNLVTATIGQTLFAFNNAKLIQEWASEDIVRLEEFAESRYQLLHDTFEKLANRAQNPLGDLKNLEIPGLAHEILRSTLYPDWKLEIRVGLGGTVQEDPLIRACTYVLGPLQFMEVFEQVNRDAQKSGMPGMNVPKLIIFDGSALAVEVNEIAPEIAQRNGQNFLTMLERFVGHFFPHLTPHVAIKQPEFQEVFDNNIFPRLREAARELLNRGEKSIVDFFATLTKQAKKHDRGSIGSQTPTDDEYAERALRYATAHLMPSVFGTISRGFSFPVLKWGGKGEVAFDAVQRKVLELVFTRANGDVDISFPHAVGSKVDALCTTGSVGGHPPPYYHDHTPFDLGLRETRAAIEKGSDPGDRFANTGEKIGNGARGDMVALLSSRSVGGWENFSAFLQKCAL